MLTANLLLRMKLGALRQNRQATNTTWQESKPDPFAHAVTFPFWLRFRVSAFPQKETHSPWQCTPPGWAILVQASLTFLEGSFAGLALTPHRKQHR